MHLSKKRQKKQEDAIEIVNIIEEDLDEHFACCKPLEGSQIYYRQKHPNQILSNDSGDVPSRVLPENFLHFAGENDNKVYFYTEENSIKDKRKTYNFYALSCDEPMETAFHQIGEPFTTDHDIKFALQQPYFFVFVGSEATFYKFGDNNMLVKLSKTNVDKLMDKDILTRPFSFCVWNDLPIVVRKGDEGKDTSVSQKGFYGQQLCVVSVLQDVHPPTSAYTQGHFYLLCGVTLFVFDKYYKMTVYDLQDSLRNDFCHIGGAGFHSIFLNEPYRFFGCDLNKKRNRTALERLHKMKNDAQQLHEMFSHLKILESSSHAIGEYSSKFAEDFSILSLLGSESGRSVFHATHNDDRWEYAVKRIAVDPGNFETALAEVRAMAQLDDPRIVRYHSTWTEKPPPGWQHNSDENAITILLQSKKNEKVDLLKMMNYKPNSHFIYIHMEMASGSLDSWLERNITPKSRNLAKMKSWFKQIVEGTEYLHGKKFIHRDLKPGNILLFDGDRLKICDMGIIVSRTIVNGVEITAIHDQWCSPMYKSPEQMSLFSGICSKSDVFSLGLIFVELCLVMNYNRKLEVFDYFRTGLMNGEKYHFKDFDNDPETASFVERLTAQEKNFRPTCRQILDDPYLA